MLSRVLVPMDESELAGRALEYALEAHPDADITVLHIVGKPSAMMSKAVGLALEKNIQEAAEKHAAEIFERAREIAQSRGVDISTDVAWGESMKINRQTDRLIRYGRSRQSRRIARRSALRRQRRTDGVPPLARSRDRRSVATSPPEWSRRRLPKISDREP